MPPLLNSDYPEFYFVPVIESASNFCSLLPICKVASNIPRRVFLEFVCLPMPNYPDSRYQIPQANPLSVLYKYTYSSV